MLIYNTFGRRKEEFVPVAPGRARVYVCGITAYDYCHIGHARSAIVFDVLVRRLRALGLETLYIRNFTDIDDKIINRAAKEGRDWREVGQTYINAFHEDMDRLGVKRPDLEPRATDYIQQIQDICSKLIQEGHAYATPGGDVYFNVRSWDQYGKLSGRSLDDMLAGARIAPDEQKKDPMDFALWKSAKPGEPSWPSPWGNGRPGWHIECSAMNQPYLPLDIHGGGQDLVFPHHDNEIAQSEALCHCQLAKYWIHNGFVRIDSEKMSKSLGNFKTIRDILENWLPETLRFFLLSKQYRSPIDFSTQGMLDAERAQRRVYASLADSVKALERAKWKNSALPEEFQQEWVALDRQYTQALDDDLNTALALGHIFAQTRLINRLMENRATAQSRQTGKMLEEFIERSHNWDRDLGLFGKNPEDFLAELRNMRLKRENLDEARIAALLAERKEAREKREFARSDELRDELAKMGILVRDTPGGQQWDFE